MFAEALIYLTTPISMEHRRLGILGDAVGLWSRARRRKAEWADHEMRTRAAIERAVEALPQRRTCAILGSGLLRDVPIDLLSKSFDQVVLVDIVHLSIVRLKVLRMRKPNIRFMTRDISGWDRLLERRRIEIATGQDEVGTPLNPLVFLRRIETLDLVISANVLSQIGIGVEARLAHPKTPRIMPGDTATRLVAAHLDALATFPCATCLITDIRYTIRDRAGTIIETKDLLQGIPPPAAEAEWDWPVAPFGEEHKDRERTHRVIAVQNIAFDLT